MALADDVRKGLKRLTEHKAFYAAAGAGDLALQTLRELQERFSRWQEDADLTELSGRALEYVMLAGAHAVQAYDELADRGMSLINRAGPVDRPQLGQAARTTAQITMRTANRTAEAARNTARTTARAANQVAASPAAWLAACVTI
jgi:hypothetical protein